MGLLRANDAEGGHSPRPFRSTTFPTPLEFSLPAIWPPLVCWMLVLEDSDDERLYLAKGVLLKSAAGTTIRS